MVALYFATVVGAIRLSLPWMDMALAMRRPTDSLLLQSLQLKVGVLAVTVVARFAVIPLHFDFAALLNNGAKLVSALPGTRSPTRHVARFAVTGLV
jgi:hypothetical protein